MQCRKLPARSFPILHTLRPAHAYSEIAHTLPRKGPPPVAQSDWRGAALKESTAKRAAMPSGRSRGNISTHADKIDTLDIDFVNTRKQILDAFKDFYTSTELDEAIDTDRIYQVLEEIRDFGIYTDDEVEAASVLEFGQDSRNVQGRIESILTPADRRYSGLDENKRNQLSRKVRSFCKRYSYVTQIVRSKYW